MIDELAALLAAQRGAVALGQLVALGVPATTASARLATGRWERPFRGVYLVPPYGDRLDAIRAAAALAVRGQVAGVSAARWWRFDAAPEESRPEVVIGHERRCTMPGATVRRTRYLEPGGGLVTSPARTLLDLAGALRGARFQVMVGDAVRRGLLDRAAIAAAAEVAGPRCATRRLYAAFARIDPALESELEQRFFDVVRRAGLPEPVPQYGVDLGDGSACYLDAAWPWAMAGAQVDGLRWHGDAASFASDRRLDRRLAARGWVVVRVTAADLTARRRELVADLAALLADRSRGVG